MFGSTILEVAIGLVFVFLFMSLICSAINEMIEAKLKNRATDLEKGIRELLMEPGVKNAVHDKKGFVEQLYKHPLICGLFQGSYDPKPITRLSYWTSTNLPSYIPNRNFAAALMDIVVNKPGEPLSIDAFRSAVDKFPNEAVRRALSSFLATAGGDIDKVRKGIESWFDSSMERVSGWYKRRTQWILVTLGFVVAIFLNINTMTVAQHLWTDPIMRSVLIAQASTRSPANPDTNTDSMTALESDFKEIKSLSLPIGWSGGFKQVYGLKEKPKTEEWLFAFVWALVGWLLTAGAVSFGAPFWFDLLNKFLTIRSTVKPQEKAPAQEATR